MNGKVTAASKRLDGLKVLMTVDAPDLDSKLARGLIESWAVNQRMHQIVLEHLDAAAWRARVAGSGSRTVAAIVVHMHNVRRKWLRLSAPHLEVVPALDRARCTQGEALAALNESAARCGEMIAQALAPGGKEPSVQGKSFYRDGWARPWTAGAAMVTYMITHEAHHRGQICMLTHLLGYALQAKTTSDMWNWEKLFEDSSIAGPT
jgi:uncharacterized damage-inducible protein DinB